MLPVKTISVYSIRNTVNGFYYVGSSQETEKRLKRHLRELRGVNHHCPFLQRAWDKYGEEKFIIEILQTFQTIEEARWLEQRILDEEEKLYNTSRMATGGDLISYHPNRDEIVAKISLGVQSWMGALSDEELREKFSRPGELNGMFGKNHSEESRLKMRGPRISTSISLKGKTFSEAHKKSLSNVAKKRLGDKNPFFGKAHSEETKQRIRVKNQTLIPPNAVAFIVDGILYRSKSEAARFLGVSTPTILYRTKSSNPLFAGYRIYDPKIDSEIDWPTPSSLGLVEIDREIIKRDDRKN